MLCTSAHVRRGRVLTVDTCTSSCTFCTSILAERASRENKQSSNDNLFGYYVGLAGEANGRAEVNEKNIMAPYMVPIKRPQPISRWTSTLHA